VPQQELAIALETNPVVDWYIQNKCPEVQDWLEEVHALARTGLTLDPTSVRAAEETVMREINDLLVYVVDPSIYDRQPFLGWDSSELTDLVDFSGKTVIDVGSGTGRLALTVAALAATVFAVEPVGNLRHYIKEKAHKQGFKNVFAVDGFVTSIPFPNHFADVTISGHVFGDHPEAEYQEMERVTRPGGMLILCPGTSRSERQAHNYLLSQGFTWSEYIEPQDHTVRKYWKIV
jgi:SAM-dependent methyltransferase